PPICQALRERVLRGPRRGNGIYPQATAEQRSGPAVRRLPGSALSGVRRIEVHDGVGPHHRRRNHGRQIAAGGGDSLKLTRRDRIALLTPLALLLLAGLV